MHPLSLPRHTQTRTHAPTLSSPPERHRGGKFSVNHCDKKLENSPSARLSGFVSAGELGGTKESSFSLVGEYKKYFLRKLAGITSSHISKTLSKTGRTSQAFVPLFYFKTKNSQVHLRGHRFKSPSSQIHSAGHSAGQQQQQQQVNDSARSATQTHSSQAATTLIASEPPSVSRCRRKPNVPKSRLNGK